MTSLNVSENSISIACEMCAFSPGFYLLFHQNFCILLLVYVAQLHVLVERTILQCPECWRMMLGSDEGR